MPDTRRTSRAEAGFLAAIYGNKHAGDDRDVFDLCQDYLAALDVLEDVRGWLYDNNDGDTYWMNAPALLEQINTFLASTEQESL